MHRKEWLERVVAGNVDTETEKPVKATRPIRFDHNPELPKLIRLLVNTGLRKNEALSLCWTDINVDEDTPTLTVRPEIAKSGRRRVIPINEKLVETLLPSMGMSPKEARKFHREQIKARNGAPIFTRQYPSKAWQKFRAMADLDHIILHQLRHNFASQLVLRGAAPSVIKRLMGHTSIETTMLYFSVRKEDEIEAVNLL